VPPWSRPGKGASPKFLASDGRACRQRVRAFGGEDTKIHLAAATGVGDALAGGIRPGHGSGLNPLVGTPADARFVNLIDAHDPRFAPPAQESLGQSRGQRTGKLSIEALILGCTRGAMREARAAMADFFDGLTLVTARRPSRRRARQMPPPNGAGHEIRQSKKSPSVDARAIAPN